MSKDFQADLRERLADDAEMGQTDNLLTEALTVLNEAQLSTYDDILGALRNPQSPLDVRMAAILIINRFHRVMDNRRIFGPLLSALKSEHQALRHEVAFLFPWVGSARAAAAIVKAFDDEPNYADSDEKSQLSMLVAMGAYKREQTAARLNKIALDKTADTNWRITVIRALRHNVDGIDTLLEIMHDETDDPYMRGEAIDPLGSFRGEADGRVVPSLIEGVSHPIFDICYWSVVALAEIGRRTENIELFIESGAFAALNHIAAAEPTTAPGSLDIHANAIRGIEEFNQKVRQLWPRFDPQPYILGPILYRDPAVVSGEWKPQPVQPTPPLTVSGWSITPDEFVKHVKKRLKRVKFNVRQPAAAYLLIDFERRTRSEYISGGLHRNGHTLVLNGEPETIAKFALWWRTLFPPEYTLYLDAREFGFVAVEPSITETNILDIIDPNPVNRAALWAAENDTQESEG